MRITLAWWLMWILMEIFVAVVVLIFVELMNVMWTSPLKNMMRRENDLR